MKKRTITIQLIGLFAGMIALVQGAYAQSSLSIDASQVYSNFLFVNSDGSIDNSYKGNYSGAYSIGYRHAFDFGLLVRTSAGMRNGGASLTYDNVNYSWDLQYLGVKVGLGYLYNLGRVSPYFSVSGYGGYLLKATQTINHQNFDIINSNAIDELDYGVLFTPGVQLNVSDYISVYGEGSYMMGLQNIETQTDGQEGYNWGINLSLGVAFTITEI